MSLTGSPVTGSTLTSVTGYSMGKILVVNPTAPTLFSKLTEEERGNIYHEIVHACDRAEMFYFIPNVSTLFSLLIYERERERERERDRDRDRDRDRENGRSGDGQVGAGRRGGGGELSGKCTMR